MMHDADAVLAAAELLPPERMGEEPLTLAGVREQMRLNQVLSSVPRSPFWLGQALSTAPVIEPVTVPGMGEALQKASAEWHWFDHPEMQVRIASAEDDLANGRYTDTLATRYMRITSSEQTRTRCLTCVCTAPASARLATSLREESVNDYCRQVHPRG